MKKTCLWLLFSLFFSCNNEKKIVESNSGINLKNTIADFLTWPSTDKKLINDIYDTLSLLDTGGRTAQKAENRLKKISEAQIQDALLSIVEEQREDVALRRQAYLWLEKRPLEELQMIPRLILRLKYEKDWPSNVTIARTLAQRGCLGGLDAIMNILATEDGTHIPNYQEARWEARKLIESLSQNPSTFEKNWEDAKKLQDYWRIKRVDPRIKLNKKALDNLNFDLKRLVSQFSSKSLRSVDDARFIFLRLPKECFEILIESCLDKNYYIREHALQTLSWIGPSIVNEKLLSTLNILEEKELNLVSVTQCRGATFQPSQSLIIAKHLKSKDYELRTAAADGLLKCGIELIKDKNILDNTAPLSPEAKYSIMLLQKELNEGKSDFSKEINGLDPNEMQRRIRWQQQRLELRATKEDSYND